NIDSVAGVSLKVNRRTGADLLRAVVRYLLSYGMVDQEFINAKTTGFKKFADRLNQLDAALIADIPWVKPARLIDFIHQYVRAKKPVIIVDGGTIIPAEMSLLNDLTLMTGNVGRDGSGIIVLRTPGNAQGLLDMGVSPNYLPGHEPLNPGNRKTLAEKWGVKIPARKGKNSLEILEGIERGEIQGLVVVGQEALGEIGNGIFGVPLFSVLLSTEVPHNAPYPHIALPAATFAESEGTYTNCERRGQHLQQALKPPTGKSNWEIIAELSNALGYAMNYRSAAEIFEEINEVVPIYRDVKEDGSFDAGKQWRYSRNGGFDVEGGLARFKLPDQKENAGIEILGLLR
ncbi:MAG TPA: molybdopterin-dependent oxidoreductase, partial [Dehalococcoidales bacterium]